MAYGLARLACGRDERPGESFADWLSRHGQTAGAIDMFWATVLVSALNERLEQMDVGHARKVFLDGFLRNRAGFQLEIPLVPLGELYGTRLETWLADHGVAVDLTTGVAAVVHDRRRRGQRRDASLGRRLCRGFRGRSPCRSTGCGALSPTACMRGFRLSPGSGAARLANHGRAPLV